MQHGDDEIDFDGDLHCDCDESDEVANDDDFMYLLGVNLVKHFSWQDEGLLGLCKRLLDAGALIYASMYMLPLQTAHVSYTVH